MTCEEFRLRMTALLDGELDSEKIPLLEAHRRSCPSCLREMEIHRQLKAMASQLHFRQPEVHEWETYWAKVYTRLERRLGWFLLIAGVSLLTGYTILFALETLLLKVSIPWPLRWGGLFFLVGILFLFLSVWRERSMLRKTDRYEGLVR